MNKILIIIAREFSTRVRKKSFLLVTIFVPILFALFYAFLIWLMLRDDSQERIIAVFNQSQLEQPLQELNNTQFLYFDETLKQEEYDHFLRTNGYYALVTLKENIMETPEVWVHSLSQLPMDLKSEVAAQVRRVIEKVKRDEVIARSQIPDLEEQLNATRTPVSVRTLTVMQQGQVKESSSEIASILGMIAGIIIYFFIFMYASQVMKGVIEEKTNRIIEVLVSSVKPFQFLLGKIIGVASVGLLQFLIWIMLGGVIVAAGHWVLMPDISPEMLKNAEDLTLMAQNSSLDPGQLKMIQNVVNTIDLGFIIQFLALFLFYFIGGYLLYASLFAAIGAASDSDTDSQQFMTPLSLILVVSLYIGIVAMRTPDTSLVFWSSLIPFTSPVVMLVRLPFGVPTWEIAASMLLLVGAFLFFTWLSGKIYRVGILMYGKKVTWKELYKWLKY